MEIAFSSYEGEKLGDFLKEYDPNFRIFGSQVTSEKWSGREFIGVLDQFATI